MAEEGQFDDAPEESEALGGSKASVIDTMEQEGELYDDDDEYTEESEEEWNIDDDAVDSTNAAGSLLFSFFLTEHVVTKLISI
jgi:hypothetical protein